MTDKKAPKAKAKAKTKSKPKAKPKAVAKKKGSDAPVDVFKLPAQVDIASAAQVCNEVKSSCMGNDIAFDASAVDRITTPGVQLLIAASSAAKNRGGALHISNPTKEFSNIVSDLGFSNQLKEWMGDNG